MKFEIPLFFWVKESFMHLWLLNYEMKIIYTVSLSSRGSLVLFSRQVNVMDTLSRLSHDTDSEVAMVR